MTRLNDVRDDASVYNNRLDTLLADVFNLLSLFFLTIGKTKEAPATYSQLASMRVSIAPQEASALHFVQNRATTNAPISFQRSSSKIINRHGAPLRQQCDAIANADSFI